MQEVTKYFGRYTVSEFALVKEELFKIFRQVYNRTTVDSICRYLAKHDWPKERAESYRAALSYVGASREASLQMLRACDVGQDLFDKVRHGGAFVREYEPVPGLEEATK